MNQTDFSSQTKNTAQEDNIFFEEIGKEKTVHAEQLKTIFKQPISGNYTSLHAELKKKCAPQNFMAPYDPEMVDKANVLYSEILATTPQEIEQLKQLRFRAIEELNIKFSTEGLYNRLKNACNPRNFTGESYNKERLELANRLYQKVLENADNVLELEEIEEQAKELIEEWEKRKKKIEEENQIPDSVVLIILAIAVGIILLLCVLVASGI